MKKILIAAAMTFAASVAFAGTTAVSNTQSNAGADASNAGNTQNITFNSPPTTNNNVQSASNDTVNSTADITSNGRQEVHYSGSFKTVPNVYAPPVGVTAPCVVGVSGGVSVIGFGVSGGTGYEDKECTKRENARMLHAFGEQKGAISLLCQNKNVYNAMPDRCILAMSRESPVVTDIIVTEQPTRETDIRHTKKRNHE